MKGTKLNPGKSQLQLAAFQLTFIYVSRWGYKNNETQVILLKLLALHLVVTAKRNEVYSAGLSQINVMPNPLSLFSLDLHCK